MRRACLSIPQCQHQQNTIPSEILSQSYGLIIAVIAAPDAQQSQRKLTKPCGQEALLTQSGPSRRGAVGLAGAVGRSHCVSCTSSHRTSIRLQEQERASSPILL